MPDLLTPQQLAEYLQLSKRTIYRLIEGNQIPVVRVGGQWRFPKTAVDRWLDLRLSALGRQELDALEADSEGPPVALAAALAEPNVLDLQPAAEPEIVRQFIARLTFPEPVDTELVVARVLEREALCSTAIPGGVAILHTARWVSRVLRSHDFLAIGRLSHPIDFGALDGSHTDLLVLVLARNERHHLVLLTKMTRLCQEADFLAGLRAAKTPAAVLTLLDDFERAVFPAPIGSE